jgi:hypothetical protein
VTGATSSPLDAALWLQRQPGGGWQWLSTRQQWAPRLLRGRAADDAPRMLPALYALCGGAHHLAARHAVAAALGQAAPPTVADRQALQRDTLREHLRRLWLDGPRLLSNAARADAAARAAHAGGAAGSKPVPAALGDSQPAPDAGEMAMALGRCPLLRNETAIDDAAAAEGRRWVEQHVFGADIDDWLAAWRIDPATVAERWSTYGRATAALAPWPARWLALMRHRLAGLVLPPRPLRLAAQPAALVQLAAQLRTDPSFALAPTTADGQTAETGCWTRAGDPLAGPASGVYAPLWMRHAARLTEIAHLSGPLGPRWLAQGSLVTGPREGLGWCEMARGLLVHWARLDERGDIADYRVLAPTEWNFHPQGAAAGWLLAAAARAQAPAAPAAAGHRQGTPLPAPSASPDGARIDVAQMRAFAAAYDPCVELHIEAPDPSAVDSGPQRPDAAAAPDAQCAEVRDA